ncbi:Do family serine endopeptidase [Altererythrobacter halimionae]|uniref:Probable periplasmic serine endoprotease DegP-like n=1 Tax=Alteriqipengyuania halimionae TaxID=1926630 RepID=A0A6I4U0Q4_9SPHN|nr:Do family serine endopeptidase [Alteriqipengyuania halimionae]
MTLATGYPAGAQVAQNEDSAMSRMAPRAGAPGSFADLTEQLQPAVVNISTTQRVRVPNNPFAGSPLADLFGNRGDETTREGSSLGSGFLVSADGYIVTNNHVVAPRGNADLTSITVSMVDGTEYEAELVGRDAASDLAVLKIERSEAFPFVKFGDSTTTRVGDWVIAIGNPFGLGSTVTSGIISAVYRNTGSGGAYDRYLQTDAAINRGNSGGPMFDLQGNVIGINNAILSPSGGNVGIGFAIPADIAAPIVERLREGKAIERGYLGVQISPVTDELADSLGIRAGRGEFVQAVEPGGAAADAGIQAGDVIVKIDGKEVTPEQTLSFIVANIKPGSSIPIELIRRGENEKITATVGKRPTEEQLAAQGFGQEEEDDEDALNRAPQRQGAGLIEDSLGVSVLPMTGQIARQLGLPRDTSGLVISVVDPRSNAGQIGLRRRDVILAADQRKVNTVEELEAIIEEFKDGNRSSILLEVQRPGQRPRFVPVKLR